MALIPGALGHGPPTYNSLPFSQRLTVGAPLVNIHTVWTTPSFSSSFYLARHSQADPLHAQFTSSNAYANTHGTTKGFAWAQPTIDPQLCSSILLPQTSNSSERPLMQARGVAVPDVNPKLSPTYEHKLEADHLNHPIPSAPEVFRNRTPVPVPNSPSVGTKPLTTGSSTEHGMGNTIVEVDRKELLAHYRVSPYKPLHLSSPSTPTDPDRGTSVQPSSKQKSKKAKERKSEYMTRKREALRKIRKFLKCERVTEEETFLRGEIFIFFTRVFEVLTAVSASV